MEHCDIEQKYTFFYIKSSANVSWTVYTTHLESTNRLSVLCEKVPLTIFRQSEDGCIISLRPNHDHSNQYEHHSGGQR